MGRWITVCVLAGLLAAEGTPGLAAGERAITIQEAHAILGDALAYQTAVAGRMLRERRAGRDPDRGSGGAATNLVTIQVGYPDADGEVAILWVWDEAVDETLWVFVDDEPVMAAKGDVEYGVQAGEATLVTITDAIGEQVRELRTTFAPGGTAAKDALLALARQPFSDPTVASCSSGARDPSSGECSLALEWTCEEPPHWYTVFAPDELRFERDGTLDPYLAWLEPGRTALAHEIHGDLSRGFLPGFAPGPTCVYMVGSKSEAGNDYLGHLSKVCCRLDGSDGACDAPFLRKFAKETRVADGVEPRSFLSFLPGEADYVETRIRVDGTELPPLPGGATEVAIEDLEPGVHDVLIEGDCGPRGRSVPAHYQVYLTPDHVEGSAPYDVASRFVEEDFGRITVTWTNTGNASHHELYRVDEQGHLAYGLTVAGRATSANLVNARQGHRVAIRSFFIAGPFLHATEAVFSEPAPPPRTRFLRGDCDASDNIDLTDAIFSLNGLFKGGELSACVLGCDTNADDRFDLADPVSTLNHIFLGGPPPGGSYPDCDETPEEQRAICPRSVCSR